MPQNIHDDPAKSERFHIRATPQQAQLIKQGVVRRKVNLAEYILDSTCARAEMDLADQAADTVGIRAMLVHALRLMLLIKDLRAFLRKH